MTTPRRKYREPQSADDEVVRADSFLNVMTGLNVAGFDKRRATSFSGVRRMTEIEAEQLWQGDDIIERAIETIPLVMLRNGFEVNITDEEEADVEAKDPDETELYGSEQVEVDGPTKGRNGVAKNDNASSAEATREMKKKIAALNVVEHFITAMQYARAYGGAAIFMGCDENGSSWKDLKRLQRKLNPKKLKDIRHLIVLRPQECWPVRWYDTDQQDPKYGSPSHYMIQRDTMGGAAASEMMLVHETRLLRFYGAVTSRRQMARNNSWGDPILLRVVEIIADFQSSYQAAAHLVTDFAQAVQKVAGLAELMAAGDEEVVTKRAQMIAMARSVARTVLIDTEEEYKREATPLTGLPELLDRFAKRVAAACHMPVTLLFGESPAGLNATGDTDVRWFYDECANKRKFTVQPQAETLVRHLFCCTDGPTAGDEPGSWTLAFAPLWQPTAKEDAETKQIMANADSTYVNAGILTPEEVADSRFGGDVWSPETQLDQEARAVVKESAGLKLEEDLEEGAIPDDSPSAARDSQRQKKVAEETAANLEKTAAVAAAAAKKA